MSLKCLTCGLTFHKKSHLCDHLYSHLKEKDLISKLCSQGVSEVYELNYFLYDHIKLKFLSCIKEFDCKFCRQRFASKTYLEEHIRYCTKEEPYICHICSSGFQGKEELYKHYLCHEGKKPIAIKPQSSLYKQHKCPLCEKRFTLKTNLNEHIHYCCKEKPYKCHICSEAFGGKPALYEHYRSHEEKKPYTCQICSEGFWEQRAFYKHRQCHKREMPTA